MNKKIKYFLGFSLVVTVVTLVLAIFYDKAFVPSFMLMLALFLFGTCYYVKDNKKSLMYVSFIMGILLIFGSLIYTYFSLR